MSAITTTAVLEGMAKALPTHTQGDDSSDLASSYEVIGLLVHSYLVALGFKLVGFQEDRPLGIIFSPFLTHRNRHDRR